MNWNAIVPNVIMSSIWYNIKMHKVSLLSNETETSSFKISWPDHKMVWLTEKILL